jgi:hypothetical protein
MHLSKVHFVFQFAHNIFRHLVYFSAQAEAATSHERCHYNSETTTLLGPRPLFPYARAGQKEGTWALVISYFRTSRATTGNHTQSEVKLLVERTKL